jgi:maleate cis-trans isomerase
VPATSTSLALGRAVRRLGRSRVEILSPYPAEIGARFIAFLAEFGVSVSAVSHLDATTGGDSRRLNVYDEVKRHEAMHGRTGVPLIIPDTAIDTLALVADLEKIFGRVVVTANQASVWDVLRLARCAAVLDNAGVLFGSRLPESSSC